MQDRSIKIINANQNNLKNVSINIPMNCLVAFIGVSGSGKTSLLFNVLHNESKCRFGFLNLNPYYAEYPEVDDIVNIKPTIVMHQNLPGNIGSKNIAMLLGVNTAIKSIFYAASKKYTLSFKNIESTCSNIKNTDDIFAIVATIKDCNGIDLISKSLDYIFDDKCEPFYAESHDSFTEIRSIVYRFNADNIDQDMLYNAINLAANESRESVSIWNLSSRKIIYEFTTSNKYDFSDIHNICQYCKGCLNCDKCYGTKLNINTMGHLCVGGFNIFEVYNMDIYQLLNWSAGNSDRASRDIYNLFSNIAQFNIEWIKLNTLISILSHSELKKIIFAHITSRQINGVTYIFDELSIGMSAHELDTMIIPTLKGLIKNNDVILIDHNPKLILCADFIVEMGPGSGHSGGQIISKGYSDQVISDTLEYARSNKVIERAHMFAANEKLISISSLKYKKDYICHDFVLYYRCINAVAIKNTNTRHHFIKFIADVFGKQECKDIYKVDRLVLRDYIKGVKVREDNMRGNTMYSSTVASYVNIARKIQNLFASTDRAILCGYKYSNFSFTSRDGMCVQCTGTGYYDKSLKITCDECNGSRFSIDSLEVLYNGKNIHNIMSMTVDEACVFFDHHIQIRGMLRVMELCGLGYIKLGANMSCLSYGEMNRLQIAQALHSIKSNSVFLVESPISGLHFKDIEKLITSFDYIIKSKNITVIMVMDCINIKNIYDWIALEMV